MKKNILITGRQGFVSGRQGFIGKTLIGGTDFTGDITDFALLLNQTQNIEGIIHLAGIAGRHDCEIDPLSCIKVNLIGLYNVLEVAKYRKIWVIFISTYQIKEKTLYALSKLMGEELCRVYVNNGLRVKIIRLPIVYGPNDRKYKVVTKLIQQVINGEEPTITTDDKFHFLYVNNISKIIESEVDILQGGFGKKYSLYDLIDGIKLILKDIYDK